MSWQAWAARIGGYAAAPWTGGASIPIGEAVAQGINANQAVNKAEKQQAAGTASANSRLDSAGATNKQVFDSQRRDFQSLANAPYQSLAQMSGIDIPDITPLAAGPSQGGSAPPPLQPSGTLASMTPAVNPAPARQSPAAVQQQFMSGYQGRGGGVQMRSPDGQVFLIPHHQRDEALANGGVEV